MCDQASIQSESAAAGSSISLVTPATFDSSPARCSASSGLTLFPLETPKGPTIPVIGVGTNAWNTCQPLHARTPDSRWRHSAASTRDGAANDEPSATSQGTGRRRFWFTNRGSPRVVDMETSGPAPWSPPCRGITEGLGHPLYISFVSTRATWGRVPNGRNVECSPRTGVRRTNRRPTALAVQGVTRPNCVIKTMAGLSDGTSVRLATGSCVYTGVVRSDFPSALATPKTPSLEARCEASGCHKAARQTRAVSGLEAGRPSK